MLIVVLSCVGAGCRLMRLPLAEPLASERVLIMSRAAVWRPTNVRAMDLRIGPRGLGAFAPQATVRCAHSDKEFGGQSPKFACRIGDGDPFKVKYGATNGEVYGEVLATRLLWGRWGSEPIACTQ